MKTSSKRLVIVIIIILAIVVGVTSVAILMYSQNNRYTVNWCREKMEKELNEKLSQSDNPIVKKVEAAHGTVDVTQAYVSDLSITTKDGSDIAGEHGENIRNISCIITTRWDGYIHKNGTTVVRITWENINGKLQVTNAKIIRTDALINMEDPAFWYEVGGAIAWLLLL